MEEEVLHLDNFAVYLERNRDFTGYIAFFSGKDDPAEKVTARMARVRDHLLCERKVPKDRLVLIDAGRREKIKTILQPVRKDTPPPDFTS